MQYKYNKIPKNDKIVQDLEKYLELLTEFSDVFSGGYEDLKVYNKDIIQHTI